MTEEVVYCAELDRGIALFARLGVLLRTIFPADDPCVALLEGHGVRVRLVRTGAPDGDIQGAMPALRPSFVVARASESAWRTGRAGMLYRDLIPDRQGGRYIASHIRISEGGPVPDYVHFHAIQLQVIYCYSGWVRVVYEDQGEPFVMRAGECVLQPPGIRHRVLEASSGLEVIELGMPAVHPTHLDHDLELPTAMIRADREFSGQRFVRFVPADARFTPARIAGFEDCELGILGATRGLAAVRVLRLHSAAATGGTYVHGAELWFHVVLRGSMLLDGEHRLGPADAFVIPAGQPFAWRDASPDLELLEIAVPGQPRLDVAR